VTTAISLFALYALLCNWVQLVRLEPMLSDAYVLLITTQPRAGGRGGQVLSFILFLLLLLGV